MRLYRITLPPALSASSDTPIPADLPAALKRWFGFETFRPGQEAVVRDALDGRDLLAVMPTGGGKSLCFQLPALLRPGVTLVVSPLIALMQDQVRLLDGNGIGSTFLNSTLSPAQASERERMLLDGDVRLLYLAPERLLTPEFLDGFLPQLAAGRRISALVIDEAHCVSEWGHDFRPEYRRLAEVRERLGQTPCWAFTATATERVRRDILAQLGLQRPALHVASFNRPNLYYTVRPKTHASFDELRALVADGGSGIVYCGSRRRVEELAQRLCADGVTALPYHAGLEAGTRREHQNRFIRDDAQVMVATIAFGMGINKPDVRWVLHYDLPRTLESYYQESGRAGRDGEPARCVLLFGVGDIRVAEYLIARKTDPETGAPLEDEQRVARAQLRRMLDYAESTECRRAVQLRYFGETFAPPCGACDNCLSPRPLQDWTREAQQFLSCVARLAQRRQRFGAAYVIELLRGAQTDKVRRYGHQALSTYGIGSRRNVDEWRHLARGLLHQGLLDEHGESYPVLALNAASRQVLRGERRVELPAPAPRKTSGGRRRAAVAIDLAPAAAALFEHLRRLRKRLADRQSVPPYVVFADAALRAMAQRRPTDIAAFAQIPGVGERKLAQYGEVFTDAIRDFSRGDDSDAGV
ncbi:MAG: DNA helicase RecQ [Gammaproteobacteria bacterium]|nr:DNA helicase RecQ [Gammaproteobacteria bacterium]